MLRHVLEIADQAGRLQVLAAGGDERLVHVERIGEAAADRAEVDAAVVQVREVCRPERIGQERLAAAEIRQVAHVFGQRSSTKRHAVCPRGSCRRLLEQIVVNGFRSLGDGVPAIAVGRFDPAAATHPLGVGEVAEHLVHAPAD